jgi:hypothetical protein
MYVLSGELLRRFARRGRMDKELFILFVWIGVDWSTVAVKNRQVSWIVEPRGLGSCSI